jgi:hypothetical protein
MAILNEWASSRQPPAPVLPAGTACCAPTNAGAMKMGGEGSVSCRAMVKEARAGASGAKRCELISQ